MESIVGAIKIRGLTATNSVRISGEKKVSTSSQDLSEKFLPELQIKVSQLDDEIVVETIQPDEPRVRKLRG